MSDKDKDINSVLYVISKYINQNQTIQSDYEKRIDELFNGKPAKASTKGIKIAESNDILELLGVPKRPLHLVENKVKQGINKHPEITVDIWRQVPNWLESPVLVFNSATRNERLVFVTDRLVSVIEQNGNTNKEPIMIVIDPNGKNGKCSVLVNTYGLKHSQEKFSNWNNNGLLRYVDIKKVSLLVKSHSGLQLPNLDNTKNDTLKILTETDLIRYREVKNNIPDLRFAFKRKKSLADFDQLNFDFYQQPTDVKLEMNNPKSIKITKYSKRITNKLNNEELSTNNKIDNILSQSLPKQSLVQNNQSPLIIDRLIDRLNNFVNSGHDFLDPLLENTFNGVKKFFIKSIISS